MSDLPFMSDVDSIREEIYLDYMASTPCDPLVVEAMLPFLAFECGNPSSPHRFGNRAQAAIDDAREEVAALLCCSPRELFFTSGATEANNIAILGCARASRGERTKIITSPLEHKSVLRPIEVLSQQGFKVELCPVFGDGQIDIGALATAINDQTLLVSVQLANNELGNIQSLREIAQLAHRFGALVHADIAQALGKISVDVGDLGLDFASMSAHKCYGPKGVGALFARSGEGAGVLVPPYGGGGQEDGLRPGTQNVPGIVGFGTAARIAANLIDEETSRVSRLRDRLEQGIQSRVLGSRVNGSMTRRLAGASSITFPGIDGEAIMANAPELAMSSSSACNSGAPEPSHVLTAIGLSRQDAYSTLRFGLGRFTTEREIDTATDRLVEVVCRLNDMWI